MNLCLRFYVCVAKPSLKCPALLCMRPLLFYVGTKPQHATKKPPPHFFYWQPEKLRWCPCAPHSWCYGGAVKVCSGGGFRQAPRPMVVGLLFLRCTPFTVAPSLRTLILKSALFVQALKKSPPNCTIF